MFDINKIKTMNRHKIQKLGSKGFSVILLLFVLVILVGLSFLVLYPILSTVSLAFRPAKEMYDQTVIWVPKVPTLVNFLSAFKELEFFPLVAKTLLVSLVCTMLQLVSCSMAAYSLSRFNYKFKNLLFLLVVFTIIVPPQTASIPNYINFREFDFFGIGKLVGLFTGTNATVNILNTNWALIIPALFGSGLQAGLYIFIFRQFFFNLPKGLEEAAKIDGCNAMDTFVRIVIPNSKSVFVVVFLLSMVEYWNDNVVTGLYLFTDKAHLIMHRLVSTVALIKTTRYVFGEAEVLFGAMAVITIIPPIILFAICQTQFTEFLDRSGIKG